jgi:hypothetical protein
MDLFVMDSFELYFVIGYSFGFIGLKQGSLQPADSGQLEGVIEIES